MRTIILSLGLAILTLPYCSHALSLCVDAKKGKITEGSTVKLRTRCSKREVVLPVAMLSDFPSGGGAMMNNTSSTEVVETNKTIQIGAEKVESIGANSTLTVGISLSEAVGAARETTIGASDTLQVGASRSESIGNDLTESVGESRSATIGGADSLEIGQTYKFSCGGAATESVGGDFGLSVGGNASIGAARNTQLMSNNQLLMQSGAASILLSKNGDIQINGKNITIKASGALTLKGSQVLN